MEQIYSIKIKSLEACSLNFFIRSNSYQKPDPLINPLNSILKNPDPTTMSILKANVWFGVRNNLTWSNYFCTDRYFAQYPRICYRIYHFHFLSQKSAMWSRTYFIWSPANCGISFREVWDEIAVNPSAFFKIV
jgi:hypothetical protein